MEAKLKKISEINDFSNVGFHFSDSEEKIESIISKGLIPQIGDNSSVFEATPKVSFSLGVDGLFQTANRFLNLAHTMPLSFFMTDTHEKYLPSIIRSKDPNYTMTTVEALEFMKNYFANCSYFTFDAQATQYENAIIPENIVKSNEAVKQIKGIPYIDDLGNMLDISYDENSRRYGISFRKAMPDEPEQNLYDTVRTIQSCLSGYCEIGINNLTPEQLKEYETLLEAKNRATIKIMDESRKSLGSGEEVADGLYDQVAFHEQKLIWRDQHKRPLNVQTRVKTQDGRFISGQGVSVENIALLSVDGNTRANNLDILTALNHNSQLRQRSLNEDFDLVDLLIEYAQIPEGHFEEYLNDHPDFANKIMLAQDHAKKVIAKQEEHDKSTEKEQAGLPQIKNGTDSRSTIDNGAER